MAHYAYKYACYDIDYEKYKQLVKKFEEENRCEFNGDPNYDGDCWYVMELWIKELIAENNQLKDELRKAQSNCNGFCGEYECKENQAICKRKPTHSSDCGCERVMHECSEKDNCRMLTILRKAQEK